jgi:hypothetical protein
MLRDTAACKSSTNYVYDFGRKNLNDVIEEVVQNHGGRLWAVLNDGPGATFQFTL